MGLRLGKWLPTMCILQKGDTKISRCGSTGNQPKFDTQKF
jgi:hypothetical protein